MAVELVFGIALVCLAAGFGAGYMFVGGGPAKRARAAELEGALADAQSELADYKGEVFGQFAATAEKFRALDKSYHDLHRQLAESSVALCGDSATPLLASPEQELLAAGDEQVVLADSEAQAEEVVDEPEPVAVDAADDHEAPAEVQVSEVSVAEEIVDDADDSGGTQGDIAEEVPTLTDIDTSDNETAYDAGRRESA